MCQVFDKKWHNSSTCLCYRQDPEWDVQPADNLIMTKVRNDRDNAEVVEQQEKMCEKAKVKGKQNKKRIEETRKTQMDLREKFIEISDFINECEQKEKEVDKKIASEKEIQVWIFFNEKCIPTFNSW